MPPVFPGSQITWILLLLEAHRLVTATSQCDRQIAVSSENVQKLQEKYRNKRKNKQQQWQNKTPENNPKLTMEIIWFSLSEVVHRFFWIASVTKCLMQNALAAGHASTLSCLRGEIPCNNSQELFSFIREVYFSRLDCCSIVYLGLIWFKSSTSFEEADPKLFSLTFLVIDVLTSQWFWANLGNTGLKPC